MQYAHGSSLPSIAVGCSGPLLTYRLCGMFVVVDRTQEPNLPPHNPLTHFFRNHMRDAYNSLTIFPVKSQKTNNQIYAIVCGAKVILYNPFTI